MSVIYSPRQMYEKFVNYMYLDYDQLVLADRYIEYQMREWSDKFEYFYDMHMFVVKCFNVLKLQKNCRIGLTVCKGKIVDFLHDSDHELCSCSKVLFKTKVREI